MNKTSEIIAPTGFRRVMPRLHLPVMRGFIDRRILVNFRCEPGALSRLLPPPFRPKLVDGHGMAGICLIRLKELRPRWFLPAAGFASENAAHRIAVEWDERGAVREGVYIPRRDTDSKVNALAGGRLFPGLHHFARFRVWESPNRFKLELNSEDGATRVLLAARVSDDWPGGSVFKTLADASGFFAAGSLGWSAGRRAAEFDGVELHTFRWAMVPLIVEHLESSFFQSLGNFPPGTAEFDSALLMRGLEHEWHGRGRMLGGDEKSLK